MVTIIFCVNCFRMALILCFSLFDLIFMFLYSQLDISLCVNTKGCISPQWRTSTNPPHRLEGPHRVEGGTFLAQRCLGRCKSENPAVSRYPSIRFFQRRTPLRNHFWGEGTYFAKKCFWGRWGICYP